MRDPFIEGYCSKTVFPDGHGDGMPEGLPRTEGIKYDKLTEDVIEREKPGSKGGIAKAADFNCVSGRKVCFIELKPLNRLKDKTKFDENMNGIILRASHTIRVFDRFKRDFEPFSGSLHPHR